MRAGASRGVSDGSPRPAVAADRGQERPGGRLEPRAGVGAGRFERLRGRHRLGDHPRTAAQLGCGDENAYIHPADQGSNLRRRAGSSGVSTTLLPGPILPKPLSMPPHDGVGLDDDEDLLPPRPEAAQRDPEEPIHRPHPRSRSLGREDGELPAEGEVLDQKVRLRRCDTSEPNQGDGNSGKHRTTMTGCGSGVNDAEGGDWV